MAIIFSTDGLYCIFCFSILLGDFMGAGEVDRLAVESGVVIFFVVDLAVGTVFRLVILVRVGVNDLVMVGAMVCVLSDGENGIEEEGSSLKAVSGAL